MDSIILAFDRGGIWMWLILGLQIVASIIILERFFALYIKRKPVQRERVKPFEAMIKRGEIIKVSQDAETLANGQPIGRVIRAGALGVMNLGGKDEIQGRMDEVLMAETETIDKRTGFLSMFANVATLAGLLGTITGMIKAFAAVSEASPAEKAALLSNGISEAMNTTAFGLIVAIPTLLAFSILSNRSIQLTEDLNQAALKAFNWLSFTFEPVSDKPRVNVGVDGIAAATSQMNDHIQV